MFKPNITNNKCSKKVRNKLDDAFILSVKIALGTYLVLFFLVDYI